MQELVRGTGRDMWFLHDPIEDDPKHTWKDYRENYYRTVTASLLHPEISSYEVCPWPRRVYTGTYPKADGSGKEPMPQEYRTNLTTVMHTLRNIKDQKEYTWLSDTKEVGVRLPIRQCIKGCIRPICRNRRIMSSPHNGRFSV